MKLNFKRIFFFVSFVLVVYQASAQNTPLNGTYTIGANGNFPTFKAAVDSLITNGVSGPVFFNIKSGTYNEQISIPDINGTSKAATITFEPESGDSTQVILSFSPNTTNNYTLQLNGGDYLKFYKITLRSEER